MWFLRFNGLLGNVDEELNITMAIRTIGADKVKDLEDFQPANPNLTIDPAIDRSLLSKQILHLYDSFRSAIHFTPDELPAAYRGDARAVAEVNEWTATPTPIELRAIRRN